MSFFLGRARGELARPRAGIFYLCSRTRAVSRASSHTVGSCAAVDRNRNAVAALPGKLVIRACPLMSRARRPDIEADALLSRANDEPEIVSDDDEAGATRSPQSSDDDAAVASDDGAR